MDDGLVELWRPDVKNPVHSCGGVVGVGYRDPRFGGGVDIRIFDFVGSGDYNDSGIGKQLYERETI